MSHSGSSRVAGFGWVVGAAVVLAFGGAQRDAFARKQYADEFKAAYVKADSSDAAEQALAAAVKEANCNVCHKGSSKKERNAYGEALAGKLEKNCKDAEKIKKALEAVAALPSDATKPDSPTFGGLIKEGKLPGGK